MIINKLDQMGHNITDKDFMILFLGVLPVDYKRKVESLEKDMDNSYNLLTVERMNNNFNMKYKKICKKNSNDPEQRYCPS